MAKRPMHQYDHQDPRKVTVTQPDPLGNRAQRRAATRAGAGQTLGPCARCRTTTVRYGPTGRPLCLTCQAAGPQ